ncbi:MAG: haloalkane dehalogenase [Coxiella sp. (in: Bacteria)]|nr:MAG: haloalkane dehalogenase [Coxiella sp. (in: g-proteobacteria)]
MEATGRFLTVNKSKMHYLESGQGDVFLFLHGIPTYSYVWRHIIPPLATSVRCVAPDLIGMGFSDKPDIDYRIFEHIDYIEKFIDQLGLDNITLVLHGWGSVVGLEYARRHPDKIKALAFYESHIRPVTEWNMLSLPVQQFAALLSRPGASYRAVVKQNYLVNRLLPRSMMRPLTDQELAAYRQPYPDAGSRRPLWQYIQDLPLGKGPDDVVSLIEGYSTWLQQTAIPKLMIYAIPGFITTVDTVAWAREKLHNLKLVGLDDALHFAQETMPEVFADALLNWHEEIK